MRVRQWAVAGAVATAAWAAGAGVAQANGATGTVPGCETSSAPATDGGVHACDADVYVSAGDDCVDPGTLTFYIDASGLEPGAGYRLTFDSDAFTGSGQTPAFVFDLVTNGDGEVEKIVDGAESADVRFPDGPFTLRFDLQDADDQVAYGAFTVDSCEAMESAAPTTTAPTATPASSTPEAPAPATSGPGAEGAVVPPSATVLGDAVLPTRPASEAPAVLATTGTPLTAMALLCGGLLAVGAGAMLAARRRL